MNFIATKPTQMLKLISFVMSLVIFGNLDLSAQTKQQNIVYRMNYDREKWQQQQIPANSLFYKNNIQLTAYSLSYSPNYRLPYNANYNLPLLKITPVHLPAYTTPTLGKKDSLRRSLREKLGIKIGV